MARGLDSGINLFQGGAHFAPAGLLQVLLGVDSLCRVGRLDHHFLFLCATEQGETGDAEEEKVLGFHHS